MAIGLRREAERAGVCGEGKSAMCGGAGQGAGRRGGGRTGADEGAGWSLRHISWRKGCPAVAVA